MGFMVWLLGLGLFLEILNSLNFHEPYQLITTFMPCLLLESKKDLSITR